MWNLLQWIYRSPSMMLAIGGVLVLGLSNAILVVWPNQAQLQAYWSQQGEQLATEYAHRATNLLTLDDRISLTVEVQRWARQDTLLGVEVIDRDGRTITESGTVPGEPGTEFSHPLYYEDELLGTLSLWQDDRPLVMARWRGLLLSLLSLLVVSGLAVWFWRLSIQRQQRTQRSINERLLTHFPALTVNPLAEPAIQAGELASQLEEHYGDSLNVLNAMQRRLSEDQLTSVYEQYLASEQPGEITDGALVKIDLLNLSQLDDKLTADAIKRLLDQTQHRCEEVLRLYHGETTQDPWLFLIRDHSDDGDFIQRTLCAAYVLNELLSDPSDWGVRPYPQFSVSIMAGPLYAGIQMGNGRPVLTVFGHTLQQVETLSTHNKAQQILLGENTFDYAQLSDVIDAEIYRDIVMPDSETLEIWRLNGFSDNWARVLSRQVAALRERL